MNHAESVGIIIIMSVLVAGCHAGNMFFPPLLGANCNHTSELFPAACLKHVVSCKSLDKTCFTTSLTRSFDPNPKISDELFLSVEYIYLTGH
jgi:hypothetical protein